MAERHINKDCFTSCNLLSIVSMQYFGGLPFLKKGHHWCWLFDKRSHDRWQAGDHAGASLVKYLQGWRVCLFVLTAIWLHCSDESKTGLFGSFQQHFWRLNFFLVANNPAHSTPFAVCDRFGILLDKSGFNPWACALTNPDRPRRTRAWVHGRYGSVGTGGSWGSFLRCRVLSRCRLLCPGARSDSLGSKDFRIETLDSDQMLTGYFGVLFSFVRQIWGRFCRLLCGFTMYRQTW